MPKSHKYLNTSLVITGILSLLVAFLYWRAFRIIPRNVSVIECPDCGLTYVPAIGLHLLILLPFTFGVLLATITVLVRDKQLPRKMKLLYICAIPLFLAVLSSVVWIWALLD